VGRVFTGLEQSQYLARLTSGSGRGDFSWVTFVALVHLSDGEACFSEELCLCGCFDPRYGVCYAAGDTIMAGNGACKARFGGKAVDNLCARCGLNGGMSANAAPHKGSRQEAE
jgi:hypothetical protein